MCIKEAEAVQTAWIRYQPTLFLGQALVLPGTSSGTKAASPAPRSAVPRCSQSPGNEWLARRQKAFDWQELLGRPLSLSSARWRHQMRSGTPRPAADSAAGPAEAPLAQPPAYPGVHSVRLRTNGICCGRIGRSPSSAFTWSQSRSPRRGRRAGGGGGRHTTVRSQAGLAPGGGQRQWLPSQESFKRVWMPPRRRLRCSSFTQSSTLYASSWYCTCPQFRARKPPRACIVHVSSVHRCSALADRSRFDWPGRGSCQERGAEARKGAC